MNYENNKPLFSPPLLSALFGSEDQDLRRMATSAAASSSSDLRASPTTTMTTTSAEKPLISSISAAKGDLLRWVEADPAVSVGGMPSQATRFVSCPLSFAFPLFILTQRFRRRFHAVVAQIRGDFRRVLRPSRGRHGSRRGATAPGQADGRELAGRGAEADRNGQSGVGDGRWRGHRRSDARSKTTR